MRHAADRSADDRSAGAADQRAVFLFVLTPDESHCGETKERCTHRPPQHTTTTSLHSPILLTLYGRSPPRGPCGNFRNMLALVNGCLRTAFDVFRLGLAAHQVR